MDHVNSDKYFSLKLNSFCYSSITKCVLILNIKCFILYFFKFKECIKFNGIHLLRKFWFSLASYFFMIMFTKETLQKTNSWVKSINGLMDRPRCLTSCLIFQALCYCITIFLHILIPIKCQFFFILR